MDAFTQFAETALSGELIPATSSILFIVAYWLFSLVSGIGFDAIDFDFDVDAELNAGDMFMGIGLMPLRWLNLGVIPVMLWLTIFGVFWFIVSYAMRMGFDHYTDASTTWDVTLLSLRNAAIALLPTKFLTNPMREWFRIDEFDPNSFVDMTGMTRVPVNSSKVGRVSVRQPKDNSDVILKAVTTEGEIKSRQPVLIVGYDESRGVHIVVESSVNQDTATDVS